MVQLQINNIYKDFKNKEILKRISTKVDFGEIYGLIEKIVLVKVSY
ncbi:hypothetical protein [Staphylococcus americanisciuri]|uniref:ABC transporter ATP-binding protein n=1 Tax=Staphylococcus americanisciuri TaxID=2973940 RepID=A0ABT2F137_9STAP|nr:hypothetical protein [Staphylococcus americanisciuri]MCS4485863.1 hypothetical protein [Staphylococcus americanisciuri]